MRLSSVRFRSFKRFTDTSFTDIPPDCRLIVLAGPNGSGKSSFFDGLKTWHWLNGAANSAWDESFGAKQGDLQLPWPDHVTVTFHEPLPPGPEQRKKLIYLRTAFRHEAEFNVSGVGQLPSPLDSVRTHRTIDADASVSENYQRMMLATIAGIYDDAIPDDTPKGQLRERVIGQVRKSMQEVFDDLTLSGIGSALSGPSDSGTFYFSKGTSTRFPYKNLSAEAISTGTRIVRLIDRDLRSDLQVAEAEASGVRVLTRRHIESYLLDDEILKALCELREQPEKLQQVISIKLEEIDSSVGRGNDRDDIKRASDSIYVRLRRLLGITQGGTDFGAFAQSTLAPLIQPGMKTYEELRSDIFGG